MFKSATDLCCQERGVSIVGNQGTGHASIHEGEHVATSNPGSCLGNGDVRVWGSHFWDVT